MIKQNQILNAKNILAIIIFGVIISTLLVINANAESRKRVYSLSAMKAKAFVTHKLTAKLRDDLVNSDIEFQFRNLEEYIAVNGKVLMKGDGFCVLTKSNKRMPLKFETILDSDSEENSVIKYNFVDFNKSSNYAPSANEEKLIKALLSKLSKDFMTSDVVIAIDAANGVSRSNSMKAYVGYGDVRVKNGSWKRVEFTVEMNLNNKTAKNVVYKIK